LWVLGGGVKGGETIETIEGRGGGTRSERGGKRGREEEKTREREGARQSGGAKEREEQLGGYLCVCRAWDGSTRVRIYTDKAPLLQTLCCIRQTSLPTTPQKQLLADPSSLHPHTDLNHPQPDVLFSTPTLAADTVAALNRVSC